MMVNICVSFEEILIFGENMDVCRKIWIFDKNMDVCRKFLIFGENMDVCRKHGCLSKRPMFVEKSLVCR